MSGILGICIGDASTAPGINVAETERATAITLGEAVREFFSYPSPRILAPVTVATVASLFFFGRWRWWDLGVAAIILGLEPLTEWLVHVHLLHFRPRKIGGRSVDLFLATKHRAHHRDPRDARLVFVPLRALVPGLAVSAIVWLLAAPRSVALSALTASFGMLSLYEWTHFLIHTSYRPRGRLYRYVWRAHRLHHYRNEHYWFGVTIHLADHLLGTFPDKDAVPVSPTARTLGIDVAA